MLVKEAVPNACGVLAKIFSILILAAMVVHLIRPLGLPGLRRRGDFWKLALVAMVAISITAGLSHGNLF